MKSIKNNDKKMNIYMKEWHQFYIKQSVERVCFEYCSDIKIFSKTPILDLDYVKTILSEYTVVYSEKDYSTILTKVKNTLKDTNILK